MCACVRAGMWQVCACVACCMLAWVCVCLCVCVLHAGCDDVSALINTDVKAHRQSSGAEWPVCDQTTVGKGVYSVGLPCTTEWKSRRCWRTGSDETEEWERWTLESLKVVWHNYCIWRDTQFLARREQIQQWLHWGVLPSSHITALMNDVVGDQTESDRKASAPSWCAEC